MTFGKRLVLLSLLLLLPAGNSLAEFKGLLLLSDFSQSLVLDYGFSGQQSMPKESESSSSLSNYFTESYNVGVEYSILHPNIVNGHLKVGLGLDQQLFSSASSSSSSSGSRYSYDLDGKIFKISPTPATFSARSETSHIQNPFSSGYDVTTDSYSVGAAFKHKILRLSLGYNGSTTETSGTKTDTRLNSDQFTLRVNNDYKNSKTDVMLFHSRLSLEPLSSVGTVATTHDVSYSIIGSNLLTLSRSGDSLTSIVKYEEKKNMTDTIMKIFSFGESFTWQLGKALSFGAGYENGISSTSGSSAIEATEERQQSGTVSLTHRLYKSLSTMLKLQGNQSDGNVGSTRGYFGLASLSYTKKMFKADTLNLNYSQGYSVTERRLTFGALTALNEPLTAQLTGTSQLQQPYVVSTSIVVHDLANPLIRYDENRDYRLIEIGAYTGFDFSIIGSRITDGQKLQVTYQYNVDANVNLQSSTHSGSALITFQEGTYSIGANVSQITQKNDTGQANVAEYSNSLSYTLGVTRNKNGKYVNIVYGKSDSEQLKNEYIEGTFRITRNFMESTVNAQIKDRQTWFGSTSFNATTSSQNSLSLNIDYNKNIFTNANYYLRASYYRFAEAKRERNDIALESGYKWGVGKLLVEATGKVQYRNTDGDNSLDEQLNIRVTRMF